MEPEIFTKMLRNLSEKLVAKFRATGLCDSRVKIARLDDATLDFKPFWESTWLFIPSQLRVDQWSVALVLDVPSAFYANYQAGRASGNPPS